MVTGSKNKPSGKKHRVGVFALIFLILENSNQCLASFEVQRLNNTLHIATNIKSSRVMVAKTTARKIGLVVSHDEVPYLISWMVAAFCMMARILRSAPLLLLLSPRLGKQDTCNSQILSDFAEYPGCHVSYS